jgi:hypothetical protein
MTYIKSAWKAIVGGVYAAASAAGIIVADLDWQAIIGAFVVGLLGVYFSPRNVPIEQEREPL